MTHTPRRPAILVAVFAFSVLLMGATQAPSLKGTFIKTNNGSNVIALDFDSTGALNVSVDGQAFLQSTWRAKADTVTFGIISGAPEGYNCAGTGKYVWAIKENLVLFTRIADDCEYRQQAMTGMAWTKG